MTLYEFNALDLKEILEAVKQYCTFLDNYITEDIKMNCYALHKIFVKVVYDGEHNVITDVRSFKYGHEQDK